MIEVDLQKMDVVQNTPRISSDLKGLARYSLKFKTFFSFLFLLSISATKKKIDTNFETGKAINMRSHARNSEIHTAYAEQDSKSEQKER